MFSRGNVTVYVSNMDRAVRFYSETLGLKLASLRRPLGFDRGGNGTHHRASPSVFGIPGRPKGVNGKSGCD